MSSTDASAETATRATGTGPAGFKLEVIVLPVADVDRAKQFYERLGWRLDAAFAAARLPGGAADPAGLAGLDHLRRRGRPTPRRAPSTAWSSPSTTWRPRAPSSSTTAST